MRVLITGVAGFIGSNLAGSLFERNHNTVIGIDDFSSSSICSSHFQELYDDARFMFYQQDISKKKFLKRLKNLQPPVYDRKKKIDVIFNLACPASPPRYQDLPVHTLDACYNGTKNVLELDRNPQTLSRTSHVVYVEEKDPAKARQKAIQLASDFQENWILMSTLIDMAA
jgi:nucleoside-diphosphate-sugar epimerase